MTTALAVATPEQQGLKTMLTNLIPSLRPLLPNAITPERLVKLALMAASNQPRLYRATQESLMRCLMSSAELGLEPGRLGECYYIPYRRWDPKAQSNVIEAQFIVGYKGLLQLARRSGLIDSIEARIIWDDEQYDIEYGDNQKIFHKPNLQRKTVPLPQNCVAVYAVARIKGAAFPQIEVMTVAEVEAIRARIKSGKKKDEDEEDKGPWMTDWAQMARKTVLRRIFNYLPCSVEMKDALEKDHDFVDAEAVPVERPTPPPTSYAAATQQVIEQPRTVASAAETPATTVPPPANPDHVKLWNRMKRAGFSAPDLTYLTQTLWTLTPDRFATVPIEDATAAFEVLMDRLKQGEEKAKVLASLAPGKEAEIPEADVVPQGEEEGPSL